jgi:hypothetical protein
MPGRPHPARRPATAAAAIGEHLVVPGAVAVVQAGQQALPDGVERRLLVQRGAGQRDHEVVAGYDQALLAVGAVAEVTVPRHPELVSVPTQEVGARSSDLRGPGIDVPPGREPHPVARNVLPVAPPALAPQQLADGGDRLGGEMQPVEPEGGAARHPIPLGVPDAHRREQAFVQQVRQTAAGHPLHHPGQK